MVTNSMVRWTAAIILALGAPACAAPKCPPEVAAAPDKAGDAAAKEPPKEAPKAEAKPAPAAREEKMRTYYMALLRRGPAWSPEKTPEVLAISKGHMDHIGEMAKSGALLVAGPFLDAKGPGDLVGVFVFGVASIDEAKTLAEADPAVKAGRFTVEVKPWMAAEGLRVNYER